MKVLVTGGCGQVGQVTVRGLRDAAHDVVVFDADDSNVAAHSSHDDNDHHDSDYQGDVQYVRGDATDYHVFAAAAEGVDAIIHLAGIPSPGGDEPQQVHHNNVVASYNALFAAAQLGIPRVIMASSVNAIGMSWSRDPSFDYFPVDQHHPTRNEDPYSLSKWLGEQQADSVVRLHPELSVASLRLHMFKPDRLGGIQYSSGDFTAAARRGLWGYTTHRMWVEACLRALTADFTGHEVFFIVADQTALEVDSAELAAQHFPGVPIRTPMTGNQGFFDTSNAKAILGWSGRD